MEQENISVSYDSEDLIQELKQDILEFGASTKILAWFHFYQGNRIFTNYDFMVEDYTIKIEELDEGESLMPLTMGKLLRFLEDQNKII